MEPVSSHGKSSTTPNPVEPLSLETEALPSISTLTEMRCLPPKRYATLMSISRLKLLLPRRMAEMHTSEPSTGTTRAPFPPSVGTIVLRAAQ
jgi:hypothetical protein